MNRTRIIVAALFATIVAAFAIGSAFALNGQDPSASITIRPADVAQDPDETEDLQDSDDDDDEADDDDDDVDDDGVAKPPKTDKAAAIAEEFGVDVADVTAHREQGIGWGALFKLYAIADAKGISVDELIAGAPLDADGEREFAFGELMGSLTDEQRAALDEHPKNFGQLGKVKKAKKDKPADDD